MTDFAVRPNADNCSGGIHRWKQYDDAKASGNPRLAGTGKHMTEALKPGAIMHIRVVAAIDPAKFPSKTYAAVMEGLLVDYLQTLDFDTNRTNWWFSPEIKQSSKEAAPAANFADENAGGLNRAHPLKQATRASTKAPCHFAGMQHKRLHDHDDKVHLTWQGDKLVPLCGSCSNGIYCFGIRESEKGRDLQPSELFAAYEQLKHYLDDCYHWREESNGECPYCLDQIHSEGEFSGAWALPRNTGESQ